MKTRRVIAVSAALAGAVSLGALGGTVAFALWDSSASLAQSITTGELAMSASDTDGHGRVAWSTVKGEKVNYTLPAGTDGRVVGPFATLGTGVPTAIGFSVDGVASGRQGIDFTFGTPTVTAPSDTTLYDATTVRMMATGANSQCTAATTATAANTLYEGKLAGLTPDATKVQHLVSTLNPRTEKRLNYCLVFTVDGSLKGSYENEVTVDGVSKAGTEVQATDTWKATVEADITPAARSIGVALELDPVRIRPAK